MTDSLCLMLSFGNILKHPVPYATEIMFPQDTLYLIMHKFRRSMRVSYF